MSRCSPAVWIAAAAALALGPAGCMQSTEPVQPTAQAAPPKGKPAPPPPTPQEVAQMLEPNVLGVTCLYDPRNPWIWNSEHTEVKGVRISALYLRGPDYTGVFGDGIIRPRLLVEYRDEKGERAYRLIKEWAYDVEQAMPFRAKRRMRAGWGYALFLNWGDLDLSGRSIRLTVSFERRDGVVLSGSKKDFHVPRPGAE